ncbi:MAG: hypothetical protein JKY34_11800 [Kordiimonadaceae bacterium]|nr:hypothetical protein [Kordiimonadaceae bacterium]
MAESSRPFLQEFLLRGAPIILTGIGVVFSGLASWYSRDATNELEANQRKLNVNQGRLDERTLINLDGGFNIPLTNDRAWINYEVCRNTEHLPRRECADREKEQAKKQKTPESVKIRVWT